MLGGTTMDPRKKRLIMRTSILLIFVVAIGYTLYSSLFADRGIVRAGDEAVNFVLPTLANSEKIELTDYRGQGVFLNFWGTYCPPCEKEMPIMEELYPEYKEQGIEILAVNVNEPPLTVERFARRYKLTFPILMDEDELVMDAYGISPLPTTILVNEHGEVVYVHSGEMDEAMIRSFMERIKPGT